jgi:hypothetical protein
VVVSDKPNTVGSQPRVSEKRGRGFGIDGSLLNNSHYWRNIRVSRVRIREITSEMERERKRRKVRRAGESNELTVFSCLPSHHRDQVVQCTLFQALVEELESCNVAYRTMSLLVWLWSLRPIEIPIWLEFASRRKLDFF